MAGEPASSSCQTSQVSSQVESSFHENSVSEKVLDDAPSFEKGSIPEKILGSRIDKFYKIFKIQWEGTQQTTLVTGEDAREFCPQLLIDYYEKHLKFHE